MNLYKNPTTLDATPLSGADQNRLGNLDILRAVAALLCFTGAAAVEKTVHGPASALFGSGTALFIAFCPTLRARGLVAIGLVSYSLYLIHTLTGGRVINLATRLPHEEPIRLAAIIFAVLVSIVAATVMYYLVEKPSHAMRGGSDRVREKNELRKLGKYWNAATLGRRPEIAADK